MSHETDSFIDEVTEEVRRDRLFRLFRRYGWIGLAIILLIVGGAAWREYAAARERDQARAWGDAALAALESDDPASALGQLNGGGNADRAAIGNLLAAGAAVDAGDMTGAQTLLERASAEAADPVLRDLARFKAVLGAGNKMEPTARDAALAELSKPGAPFRLLALEQKAVALIAAGRPDDAVTLLREILQEDGVSQSLRTRASETMIALGAPPEAPAGDPLPDGETIPAPAPQ